MTDIVKGMLKAYYDTPPSFGKEPSAEKAMRAALMWLADNVSDEMVEAYEVLFALTHKPARRDAIAAALRAAAGEEGK